MHTTRRSCRLGSGAVAVCLLAHTIAARGAEHFFDSDGVRIRYTDEGQGPPVLLIHGYSASADLNWRVTGVIGPLAKHFRVITLDNRGHGRSDKPVKAEDYGVKMVTDAQRLLDELNVPKAHVVGYSMGGMIALKMATIAPDRMLSAVIGGMGWLPTGPIAPVADGDDDSKREGNPLRACARAFPTLGITREELLAIKVPMIVVIGTADSLLESRVNPLHEARPDIPIIKIAGANHVTCNFRKDFHQAIQDFLDKQVASAGVERR